MPSFDELLKEAGEFGRFQKGVFLLLCQTGITFSFLFVGIVFLGQDPEQFWCRIPGATELSVHCGWSLEEENNFTVSASILENDSFHYQCDRYELEWNTSTISCANPLYHLTNNSSGKRPPTKCQDGWLYKQPHSTIASEVREFPHYPDNIFTSTQDCRVCLTRRWERKQWIFVMKPQLFCFPFPAQQLLNSVIEILLHILLQWGLKREFISGLFLPP